MEQATQISLSVLVTKDEYIHAQAMVKQKLRAKYSPAITATGALLAALGIAGLFFGRLVMLSAPAAVCLVLLGVFLALYDGFIGPVLNKAAAAREYNEKEDLHFATAYVFSDDRVRISNGRIQGEIPISRVTGWIETPSLIRMSVGRELNICVPKRLLSQEQAELLRGILEKHAPAAEIK